MDGRDTPPESGVGYLEQIEKKMREIGVGRIATRFRPLLRDGSRQALGADRAGLGRDGVGQRCESFNRPRRRCKRSYEHGVTDEFIEPVTIVDDRNEPVGLIREDDALRLLQLSRRPRPRDDPGADRIARQPPLARAEEIAYHDDAVRQDFRLPFVLPPEHPNNILANVMAAGHWKNLRVAETEKYAHVTYFFNGGNEKPYRARSAKWLHLPRSRPTICNPK